MAAMTWWSAYLGKPDKTRPRDDDERKWAARGPATAAITVQPTALAIGEARGRTEGKAEGEAKGTAKAALRGDPGARRPDTELFVRSADVQGCSR